MKNLDKIKILLFSVLLSVGVIGCSDDDDVKQPEENTPEFVLGQDVIQVKIGSANKAKIDIKQGGGEYNAFILDEKIAHAEVADGSIMVEGLSNGETSLVVSDKYSRYRRVNIDVYTTEQLQLSHTAFDLLTALGNPGTSKVHVVSGNGEYKVTSDNKDVNATIDTDGVISLTATSKKDSYKAKITVVDRRGLSASIDVTVKYTLEAFSDDELAAIASQTDLTYIFDKKETGWPGYYTYLNETTDEGKQRYGWEYFTYYWLYLDFMGGKEPGAKQNATFTYSTYNVSFDKQPVDLKIIKNDGKNIWGVFSFINESGDKILKGYFCDAVNQ